MHHIFILIGKSASGKDTIYERLAADPTLALQRVVPYTTRPIRSGEKEGEEYHFVTEPQFHALQQAGRIIESRCYNTCYGPWYYFTADDGQLNPEQTDSLMIGTLESFQSIAAWFGRDTVIPLYIEVDNATRLQRARARESTQQHPKYDELARRFAADEQDFSEEKIQAAGIHRRFRNDDLSRCLSELMDYITSLKKRPAFIDAHAIKHVIK